MLTASMEFSNGYLYIEGTEDADVITISSDENNNNLLQVAGATGDITGVTAEDVTSIYVVLKGGDDYLDLSGVSSAFSALISVQLYGNAGNDHIYGSQRADIIEGGDGDDVLEGNAGDDIYIFSSSVGSGNLGTDTLVEAVGGGKDTLDFLYLGTHIQIGLSSDYQQYSTTQIVADSNNVYLALSLDQAAAELEDVRGTNFSDVIWGNAKDNCFQGLNGDDELVGLGNQTHYVSGGINGAGDRLVGGGGNDRLYGDYPDGGVGNGGGDYLSGGANDDTLEGGAGDDYLSGSIGNDRYVFRGIQSLGMDTMFESGGTDTLDFSGLDLGAGVNIDLRSQTGQFIEVVSGTDGRFLKLKDSSFLQIENVIGTDDGDYIVGNAAGNTLTGGLGNDVLEGGVGVDVLEGGGGDDMYVFAGSQTLGQDSILEGPGGGTDTLDFNGIVNATGLVLDLESSLAQTAILAGAAPLLEFAPLANQEIEKIIGTSQADTIGGNQLNNELRGGAGDDLLFGRSGNDTLYGEDGNDTLRGGLGNDLYYGGAGLDDPEIIDDQDGGAGFSITGSGASLVNTAGFNGTYYELSTGSTAEATWLFQNLPAGWYEIFVTWPNQTGLSAAAPFSVKVDNDDAQPFAVDQSVEPDGDIVADRKWHQLGEVFNTTTGTLEVKLAAPATGGPVAADAVRVVRTTQTGGHLAVPAEISGTKFNDNYQQPNGIRDSNLIEGDHPNVVFVIDVSESTSSQFQHAPGEQNVPNINGDEYTNSVLDAELSAFIALNQNLIGRGLGSAAQVAIVVFGTTADYLDMVPDVPGLPETQGIQIWTSPSANADGVGYGSVEEVLRSVVINMTGASGQPVGIYTNYEAALDEAYDLLFPIDGADNAIFLSDGQPNTPSNNIEDYEAEVEALEGANVRAFGVAWQNISLFLGKLQAIDPSATVFDSSDDLLAVFGGLEGDSTVFLEPPLEDFLIYIDANGNGVRDGAEPFRVTDEQGHYLFQNLPISEYHLREQQQPGWQQIGPGGNGEIVVTIDQATDVFSDQNFGNIEQVYLTEETRLVTTDADASGQAVTLTVPEDARAVRIKFTYLQFDSAAGNPGDINDAFEVSLLKADGTSVLPTIGPNSDALFNITQGQSPIWAAKVSLLDESFNQILAPGAGITEGYVEIDISSLGLPPGTPLTLSVRLVNNDADNTSQVLVDLMANDEEQGKFDIAGDGEANLLATPANQTDRILTGINFNILHDVTRAFELQYQHTTIDAPATTAEHGRLDTRLSLRKTGSLQVRGDLLLAIKTPIGQVSQVFDGTQVAGIDGRLPFAVAGLAAGTPYVRLSNLIPTVNGFYVNGESVEQVRLLFDHLGNERFDYELVVLGELNEAPTFVSDPYADVRGNAYPIDLFPVAGASPVQMLEIVAQNGNTFRYRPTTQDRNNDRVRIQVVGGPVTAAIDTDDDGFADTIEWTPEETDAGVHQFVLRGIDEHGAFDPANDQTFNVRVVATAPNRPPQFTTSPTVLATFGEQYSYDADAFDPDGHALAYSGTLGARPQQYQIQIGQSFTGVMSYLTLINEPGAGGLSTFSNIRLYEAGQAGQPQVLKFSLNRSRFVDYGSTGTDREFSILGDGSVIRLTGDTAIAYRLDTPYQVTANTVLAFTFASEEQGLLQGIGLDENTAPNNPPENSGWFNVYGTGTATANPAPGYTPEWSETPVFNVNLTTGAVTWAPPAEAIGQWVHVDLTVSDQQSLALTDTQSYELLVTGDPVNTPPQFVSTPAKVHYLPAPPIPLGDPVDPPTISRTLNEDEQITRSVAIDLSQTTNKADIVFIVDESGSMDTYQDWLGQVADDFELEMNSRGFNDNHYALVGYASQQYGYLPRSVLMDTNDDGQGDSLFGTVGQLITAIDDPDEGLQVDGQYEDGYSAIDYALSYEFRSDAIVTFVLITDEDRHVLDPDNPPFFDFTSILESLRRDPDSTNDDILLNVVVDGILHADDGNAPPSQNFLFDPNDPSRTVGTWTHQAMAYTGRPTEEDEDKGAVSVRDHNGYPLGYLNHVFDTSVTIEASEFEEANGYIVFDYQSQTDFKFAGIDAKTDSYVLGSRTAAGGWEIVPPVDAGVDLKIGETYELSVLMGDLDADGDYSHARLFVDGLEVASHDYEEELNGLFGLATFDSQATFHFFRYGTLSESGSFTDYVPAYSDGVPPNVVVVAPASFGGVAALGVDAQHNAYLPDGFGDYTGGSRGEFIATGLDPSGYYYNNTWRDYVLLAWQTGGAVWDLDFLSYYSPSYDENNKLSFSKAFAEVLSQQLQDQIEVHLELSNEEIPFSYVPNPEAGDEHFLVTFTGDGRAHNFNIEFVTSADTIIGEIPVAINAGYTYDLAAIDVDGDSPLTFSWTNGAGPDGAVLDGDRITWNPSGPGSYEFSVTVADGRGGFDEQNWTVVVYEDTVGTNAAPVITATTPPNAQQRRDWAFQVTARDDDGDTLRYYLVPDPGDPQAQVPTGLEIDRNTGLVTWQPTLGQAGEYTFWVLVSDGRGGEYIEDYSLDVGPQTPANQVPPNEAPNFVTTPTLTVVAGQQFTYTFSATDADGDKLTYALPYAPKGMVLDAQPQTLYWTTTEDDVGRPNRVILTVRDAFFGYDVQDFFIEVISDNVAPEINPVPAPGALVGQEWTYQVLATDANGDDLAYQLKVLTPLEPSDTVPTIDPDTGAITWNSPTREMDIAIEITVSDGRGGLARGVLVVPVRSGNHQPEFNLGGAPRIYLGEEWSYQLAATDYEDGSSSPPLVFSIDAAAHARGIALSAANELIWTPTTDATATVLVTVTDSGGLSRTIELTLPVNVRPLVNEPNEPPQFKSQPSGAAFAGRTWSYLVTAADLDGDDIDFNVVITDDQGNPVDSNTYTLAQQADGLFGEKNVLLTWTPPPDFVGWGHFEITITDGTDEATQIFEVPVIPNYPPFIIGPDEENVNLGVEEVYEFQAIDFNGDNLRIELVTPAPGTGRFTLDELGNNPIFSLTASSDPESPSTFYLQFTPDRAGRQNVTVRVTDTAGKSAEHTIHLNVTDPTNVAPEVWLEGPQKLFLGDTLDIRVQGDNPDADGDKLHYYLLDDKGNQVTELTTSTAGDGPTPSGMKIDPLTGRITWKPIAEQVSDQPYTFQVQVTDGRFFVDIGPAEIRVSPLPAPVEEPMVNNEPYIVRGPVSVRLPAAQSITFTFGFFDYDGDVLQLQTVSGLGEFADTTITASANPQAPTMVEYTLITPSEEGGTSFTISFFDGTVTKQHTVTLEIFDPNAVNNHLPTGSLDAREFAAVNELFVAQVTGSDPDPGDTPIFWLVDSGGSYVDEIIETTPGAPTGMRIDPATGRITWTPTALQFVAEPYFYTVAIDDDNDPDNGKAIIDDVDVTVVSLFTNTPPRIVSQPEGKATGNGALAYQAIAEDADGDPLTWSLVSGPSTASIGADGLFTWQPADDELGETQTAIIEVRDPYGGVDVQTFALNTQDTYTPANTSPRFVSTAPLPGFGGETYTYLVRAVDDEGHAISLRVEAAAGSSLDDTEFTDNGDGTGAFIWREPDAGADRTFIFVATDELGLSSARQLHLVIGESWGGGTVRVDTPPTIHNKPPTYIGVGNLYYHKVDATDPDASPTNPIIYSLEATREGQSFSALTIGSSTGVISWTPQESDVGEIRVTIKAMQGGAAAIQSFTLQVIQPETDPTNPPPTLYPGRTLTATPGQAFVFDVPGADPAGEAVEFFLVDSSGSLVREIDGLKISADGRVTWSVPVDIPLTTPPTTPPREFTVALKDAVGQRAAPDANYSIAIVDDRPPSVGLSLSTLSPEEGTFVDFSIVATDDLGVADLRLTVTPAGGAPVNVPVAANGSARFNLGLAPAGTTFTVVATAVDTKGQPTSTSPIQFTVRAVDTDVPTVAITSPSSGTTLTETVELIGTITDTDNQLVYYSVTATPYGGGAPITLIRQEATQGTYLANITGARITDLSPFALDSGIYQIDVLARDAAGKQSVASIVVGVETEIKLGNFALSFTDMTVTVGGLPITIIRRYDTLDAGRRGDFGYGWSMDVIKGKMEYLRAGEPGNNPLGDGQAITAGSRITITLPGGEQHSFTAVPVPPGRGLEVVLGLTNQWALAFRPDPRQASRLDFVGSQQTTTNYYPIGQIGGWQGLMPQQLLGMPYQAPTVTYNEVTGDFNFPSGAAASLGMPANFDTIGSNLRLMTRDGRQYEFDPRTGELLRSTDRFLSQVDFTGNDIVARDAGNVEVGRLKIIRGDVNNPGLITRIEDVEGNAFEYDYDSAGNLIQVWDRTAVANSLTPTATYRYGEDQNSDPPLTLSDPGVDVPDHILTTIENAMGVAVLRVGFDSQGRLRKIQDASGAAADFSYDFDLVDGSGRVVEVVADANGISTEIVRDRRGNVERRVQLMVSSQDPSQRKYLVTKFVYDANDRQTHVSVPFEVVGEDNRFSANLNPIIDPSNPSFDPSFWQTRSTFDDAGNLISSTNAAGAVTSFDYYDQHGNPGRITDAAGNSTINVFFDGQLTDTIDAAGGRTRYGYDAGGNLTLVTQVGDNNQQITTVFGYDEFGNLTDSTGPDGQSRLFVYDELGNQTLSYFHWEDPADADSLVDKTVVTRTFYDLDGRVTATAQYTVDGQQWYTGTALLDAATPDWTSSTQYNTAGQVEREIDRFGIETYSLYDARGNLVETRTKTKNESGDDRWIVARTFYDNNGRPVATTDPFVVQNDHDPLHPDFDIGDDVLPLTVDLRVTQTIYDDAGRVQETRRLAGVEIVLTRNTTYSSATIYATSFTEPAATAIHSRTETVYNGKGQIDRVVTYNSLLDPLTDVLTTVYFEYDSAGRQTAVVQGIDLDQNGAVDVTDGDLNGVPDGGAELVRTQTTYDAAGRVQTSIDANGTVTRYIYDALGRVTTTIADEGAGKLNVASSAQYDRLGRRTAEIDPLGQRTEFQYDTSGRLTEVRLPEITAATTFTGSTLGAPVYQYAYDPYGNQVLIRDPMDKETLFAYDHLGRQTSRTLPDLLVETMVYNDTPLNSLGPTPESSVGLGQLEYSEDFEGRVTAYRYDNTAGGRLVGKYYYASLAEYDTDKEDGMLANGTPPITSNRVLYTYDALGRVVVTNDSQFTTPTTQAYDADGRLVKLTSPQGYLNYAYDKLGRLTRTWTSQAADGVAPITDTVYAYDELGRLKTVQAVKRNSQNLNEGSTTYRYDRSGNLDLVLYPYPNPAAADYVYDSLNRLDKLTHFRDLNNSKAYDQGDTLLASFDYTVRPDGKRTQVIELDGAGSTATIDWVYDELGRLIEERFDTTQGSAANDYIARYGFDLAGNRILMAKDLGNAVASSFAADETTSYIYDANDRLLSEQLNNDADPEIDRTTTYAYTGTQQTGKTVSGDVSETHVYQYDMRGRMSQTAVTKSGSTTTNTYKYNADGIRVGMTEQVGTGGVTTTVFHIDPYNHTGFAQVLEEGVDSNIYIPADGRLQSNEISLAYALGHDVIEQGAGSGVTSRFYLYDGHGSTRGLMNFAASVLQRYAYDAYGNQLAFGNLTPAASASTRFLYSGERTDKATGWQNLQVRYLDPQTGRFITLDPADGHTSDPQSLHKYLYVHADPVQGVDPTGLEFSLAGQLSAGGIQATIQQGIGTISTIVKVYNTVQRVLNIIDYTKTIIDFVGALAQPTPQAAIAALVSALQNKFSVTDLSSIINGFNAAVQKIAGDWDDIAARIGAKAADIAKEAAQEALRRLPAYTKALAEGRLRLVFFAPSGPFGKQRNTYFDIGNDIQIGVSPGGGRLFGFGIRTSKENVDPVFRIDYWDTRTQRPTPTPLHVHYHVYDIIDHKTIWP